MFKPKYTVSLLNSKWEPLKRNLKISIIPRRDEFIYFNDKYYIVLNVVHTLNKTHDIFVIIEEYLKDPQKEIG